MHMIWVMLALLAVFIVRVVKGPSIWDRLLGLSVISTKVILIIVFFASYNQIAYLLDIAIVFVLLGFISIIFTALFLLQRIKAGGK
ncbi:MAG: monovalent cation/H+ antiporter complex subunit F [Clostridia bacterium]|nr:monovalent cation/H+ antiporter complex subunit F [Clostridia bacterium]